MLRALRVSDLAIIDEVELVLEPGFNVLTGETGAGKSILLEALELALGQRADTELVRSGAEEAVVEALFTEVPKAVNEALVAAGLRPSETGGELVVRRVLSTAGRSRAYVNGALAPATLVREIAPYLVRIYGQGEDEALRRVESHLALIDASGGLGTSVTEMQRRYARLVAAREALEQRRQANAHLAERLDLLRYQLDELTKANLAPGEDELLAVERTRLASADRLGQLASAAEQAIYSEEGAIVERLGRALTNAREAERLDKALEPIRMLLESALAELEDAGRALGRYLHDLAPDPAKLAAVEDRLSELGRLKRKYGGSLDEVLRKRDEVANELAALGDGDGMLAPLQAEVDAAEKDALDWAKRLAVERRRVAKQLERALTMELRTLAMDGARFEVRFADADATPLGPSGRDDVEFFLSANQGEELRSLARVASGGERARIMLALKALGAADEHDATLVFDEVDTGIGGAVAEVVARKLQQLGRKRQVLSVTHLPVIAAYGDHHLAVTKRVVDGRTVSRARALAATERVAELARMLAGARITPEAREHAEQLLRQGGSKRGRAEARTT
ncbi:MAG TPA: DNA repair protein RecN [Candidatus Limnocylindria bacterium]|nr:DNA repair protein RecN [Candidatus Limnocylindria bacterium]